MAFTKIKFGEKEFNAIEFGVGDILMYDHLEINRTKEAIVSLIQHTAKDIGEWRCANEEHKNTDDFPLNTLMLKFNRVESIDMFIEVLQDTRKILIN